MGFIDTRMEYVACAAIHYDNGKVYPNQLPYGVKTGFVLCGIMHASIIGVLPTNTMYLANHPDEGRSDAISFEWNDRSRRHSTETGFVTSYGRFVDRREAYRIAIACGQIEGNAAASSGGMLYSEDIFFNQKSKI